MTRCKHYLALLTLLLAEQTTMISAQPEVTSLDALRVERTRLAAKSRGVIANNDGCDVFYFPNELKPTVQNFLSRRLTVLTNSQVSTVAYCTISSGFGHFTHNTKIGQILTRQGKDYGIKPETKNITADLISQNTDTLRAVTDFAHANKMECFWSMRMNDTHDAAHQPDKPYLLFPKLKEQHPKWLVGNHIEKTKYGRWSSVDYAHPGIRELAYKYIEEVCRNYDIDGIDLDFCRHLCYFRSVAHGAIASEEELTAMTDLMRRIRSLTEQIGMERKRPILISMRLPDCAEYCRAVGLDLENWLREGLLDIFVPSFYFRLNPWEYSVQLGHKYGVKVYPSLDEPRVKNETRFQRKSREAYRGRAAKAWAAGADGVYLFNLYDVKRDSPLWHELGDPIKLAYTDKCYFVTDRDGNPAKWLVDGRRYWNIPLLTPGIPCVLWARTPCITSIIVADDLKSAIKAGMRPEITLHLALPELKDISTVRVTFNGEHLINGLLADGWLDFTLQPQQLRQGENAIEIHYGSRGKPKLRDVVLNIRYQQ